MTVPSPTIPPLADFAHNLGHCINYDDCRIPQETFDSFNVVDKRIREPKYLKTWKQCPMTPEEIKFLKDFLPNLNQKLSATDQLPTLQWPRWSKEKLNSLHALIRVLALWLLRNFGANLKSGESAWGYYQHLDENVSALSVQYYTDQKIREIVEEVRLMRPQLEQKWKHVLPKKPGRTPRS